MDTIDSTQNEYHGSYRRPLMALISELWRDSATLLRDEAELAKAEISEKVSQLGTGIGSLALAGAVLFAGFLLVLLAVVGLLAQVLPEELAPWLAPLLVGAVVLFAGWMLLSAGRHKLTGDNLTPRRTVRSVQLDAELVKEHIK